MSARHTPVNPERSSVEASALPLWPKQQQAASNNTQVASKFRRFICNSHPLQTLHHLDHRCVCAARCAMNRCLVCRGPLHLEAGDDGCSIRPMHLHLEAERASGDCGIEQHVRFTGNHVRQSTFVAHHIEHHCAAQRTGIGCQGQRSRGLAARIRMPDSYPVIAPSLRDRRGTHGHRQNCHQHPSTFHVILLCCYCCFASEAVASVLPRPIVSTADDGTITIVPFSLIAS